MLSTKDTSYEYEFSKDKYIRMAFDSKAKFTFKGRQECVHMLKALDKTGAFTDKELQEYANNWNYNPK